MLATKCAADLRKGGLCQLLTRYMATAAVRQSLTIAFFPELAGLMEYRSATAFWMESIVILRLLLQQSLSTCCAMAMVIGVSVRDE